MMGNKFWTGLRATVKGLSVKEPMVKIASAKDPNRVAVAEAKASGFFVKAKSMGWGLYQVEELDGGLGSIWHVEKDAATGEQFLVKQVDPVGDIVRRVRTASMNKVAAMQAPWKCSVCGADLPTDAAVREHKMDTGHGQYAPVDRGPGQVPGRTASTKTAVIEPGAEGPLGVGDDDLEPAPAQPAATPAPMSDMVRSYLGTALWAETDDSNEQGGDPLDRNYSIDDFAPEAVAKAVADCAAFEQKAGSLLDGIERQGQDVPDVIGFHFWLTRNGHGAGFWDGDYPKEIGEALTKLSDEFGTTNAYVGDDGKLYLS